MCSKQLLVTQQESPQALSVVAELWQMHCTVPGCSVCAQQLTCPVPAAGRTLAKQAVTRAVGSSTHQAFSLAAHHRGAWTGRDSPDTAGTHLSHPQPKNNSAVTFLRCFVSIIPLGCCWHAPALQHLLGGSHQDSSFMPRETFFSLTARILDFLV